MALTELPLIDREKELRMLKRMIYNIKESKSPTEILIIGVTGLPGIGKTKLLETLYAELIEENFTMISDIGRFYQKTPRIGFLEELIAKPPRGLRKFIRKLKSVDKVLGKRIVSEVVNIVLEETLSFLLATPITPFQIINIVEFLQKNPVEKLKKYLSNLRNILSQHKNDFLVFIFDEIDHKIASYRIEIFLLLPIALLLASKRGVIVVASDRKFDFFVEAVPV